ncbi:serine protease [Croceicoccus sp. YJ47]|uniref:S1 family peptidase n=1 Tax=Croceicoccus sp. YJ47 TaxID=2798724 RepID=UPI001920C6D6|nr:serine protease [Croceicoccus sp. YJ47]QQN73669.1 trypsin-like peptidase domain-containing protein [Croceicoccus sp. YJ47]
MTMPSMGAPLVRTGRRAIVGFLALLAACIAICVPATARADTADINAAARSVVRVVIVQRDSAGYDVIGHGTGFAVTPTLIVTNAHVLAPLLEDERLQLGVVPAQGKSGYFARIVRVASDVDLALIELTEDATLPVATLYSGAVGDGSDVFAVGYPANVDQAIGLGLGALTSPQAPVKSRGQVSGGRTASQYDTILHTAPIGVGNSGGPLLDPCGRVVGVNSFGTISDNGSDSEFYFAVSMREIAPFLREAGVNARFNAQPCRSMGEYDAQQDARAMREASAMQARQAAAAARLRDEAERAGRRAELEALDQRETMMALAGALLAVMVLAVIGTVVLYDRDRREAALACGVFAGVALLGALVAWFSRPGIAEIERRGEAAQEAALDQPADRAPVSPDMQKGRFTCRLVPERSRVTVSDASDISLGWDAEGCVNGRTQYGLSNGEWSRVLVPNSEQTVSVNRYDPEKRIFTTDRFLVDLSVMNAAREARGQYQTPACGGGEDAARELGENQDAIRAMLPDMPNERLTYICEPAADAVLGEGEDVTD